MLPTLATVNLFCKSSRWDPRRCSAVLIMLLSALVCPLGGCNQSQHEHRPDRTQDTAPKKSTSTSSVPITITQEHSIEGVRSAHTQVDQSRARLDGPQVQDIKELRNRIQATQQNIRQLVQSIQREPEQLVTETSEPIENRVAEELAEQIEQKQRELQNAKANLTPAHPHVVALQGKLVALRRLLEQEVVQRKTWKTSPNPERLKMERILRSQKVQIEQLTARLDQVLHQQKSLQHQQEQSSQPSSRRLNEID